jgi:dephospho-CoA kinase
MRRPFVVGICGGIGSGKTAAARAFERLGARVIDADRVAHDVLTEPEVVALVRRRFGEGVMVSDEVDRGALAKVVFGPTREHEEALRALEAIVHPRILSRIESQLVRIRSQPSPPEVVIVDAPLLSESPLAESCDEIVFVEAPEAVRMSRTRAARSWAADDHRARERAQKDLEKKRAGATRVLSNAGSLEDLERACAALWAEWTGTT